MKTIRFFIRYILVFAVLLQTASLQAQKKELFRDESAPHHERIMDLLSRLTVEEKISLLRATSPEISRLGIDKYYHGNEALHEIGRAHV